MIPSEVVSYVLTTGMGLVLSGVGYLIRKITTLSEQMHQMSIDQQVIKSRQEIQEHVMSERLATMEADIRELRGHGVQR